MSKKRVDAGRDMGNEPAWLKETPANEVASDVAGGGTLAADGVGAGLRLEEGKFGQEVSEDSDKKDADDPDCGKEAVEPECGKEICSKVDAISCPCMKEIAEGGTGLAADGEPEGAEVEAEGGTGLTADGETEGAEAEGKNKKCAVCSSTESIQRCSHCKATWYCSRKCQVEHYPHHSKYCSWIVDLQKLETEKVYRGFRYDKTPWISKPRRRS